MYVISAITRSTSSGDDNCYDTAADPLECLVCSDLASKKCKARTSFYTEKSDPAKSKCDFRFVWLLNCLRTIIMIIYLKRFKYYMLWTLIHKMELQMLWIPKGLGNCICWYTNKRSMREKWAWKTSQGLRNNSWIRIRINCTSMLQLVVLQFQLYYIDFDGP